MKEAKSINYVLVESFLVYIQKNFDLIENFIKEVRKCEDLEEQRYKIFDFMLECFNKNKTAKTMQLIRESNAQHHNENIRHNINAQPVKNAVEDVMYTIYNSLLVSKKDKDIYLKRLSEIDVTLLEEAYRTSIAKLTLLDMKYIICFLIGADEKDISLMFNVAVESAYKTRYRIRNKFSKDDSFRLVL